jgi:protein required for attachment to host cells
MNNCCVVATDGMRARIFVLERAPDLVSGSRLVEWADLVNAENAARGRAAPYRRSERNTSRQAGPMHPYGEKRQRHRLEVERRFAGDVAKSALSVVAGWSRGSLLVVAEPHMLGLMRDALRGRLPSGIQFKELAKDYTHFTPSRLRQQLGLKAG